MSPITTEQWEHVVGMLADAYSDSGGLKGAWAWLQAQGHTLGFSTFKAHLRIERETRRIAGENASEALTATAAVPMLDGVPLQIDAPLPATPAEPESIAETATTMRGWRCGACKLSLESRSWVQEELYSADGQTEKLTCGTCYAARPEPADEALAWTAQMGPADARADSPLVALALAPAIFAVEQYKAKAEAARRVLDEQSAEYMNFAREFKGSSDLNGTRYLLRFLSRRPKGGLRMSEWTPQWIRVARRKKKMGECPSRGCALLRGVCMCVGVSE
jgi:hypothetical protein